MLQCPTHDCVMALYTFARRTCVAQPKVPIDLVRRQLTGARQTKAHSCCNGLVDRCQADEGPQLLQRTSRYPCCPDASMGFGVTGIDSRLPCAMPCRFVAISDSPRRAGEASSVGSDGRYALISEQRPLGKHAFQLCDVLGQRRVQTVWRKHA